MSSSKFKVISNLVWAFACATAVAQQAPTVTVSSGPIQGTLLPSNVKAFLGIPFAQSPPLRFGAPVDANSWSEPLKATAFKPACLQQFSYPERVRNFTMNLFNNPAPEESEDCLYINVWSPAAAPPPGGYPVMFWIYGGNLQFGTGRMPEYNGESIAATRGVVVVNFNYRTNVFGFPNSPELPKGEGNPGFLDQRKALDWATKNIAAFGGDPAKVTIFGESAGGWSVKQLVALPPKPLPFRAAIIQSEAAGVSGGASAWQKLAAAFSCASNSALSCIRAVPAQKIKDFVEREGASFDPIKDDVTSSKNISLAITSGQAAKVPIIIGSNADDGTAFAIIFGGGMADDTNSPIFKATAQSLTEVTFQCPSASIADLAAANGYPSVYRYFFNASFPQYQPFKGAGAYHEAEIPQVFGTYEKSRTEMNRLSGSMQTKWTDFAKDPSSPIAGWPKVVAGKQQALIFGTTEDKVVDAITVDTNCASMAADIAIGGL